MSDTATALSLGPVWEKTPEGKWLLPKATLGWEILGWTKKYIRQPDGDSAGQPWEYTDEQARLVLWWYAVDENGIFTYRYGVMRRPKGHGKDPFAASLAIVELCGPCRFAGWNEDGSPRAKKHPAPWVQVAAVNQDQTKNTMVLFPGMISDRLKNDAAIDLGKTVIYARQGRARLEAVTSSPRALEGARGTFVILNETQHWLVGNEGVQMAKVVKRNAGKSRDSSSRAFAITNAHLPGEGSVGENDWEAALATQLGDLPAMGVLYDSLEAPDGLDPKNPADVATGILAARGDSHWAPLDRTVQEFMDPSTSEAEAQRFYWNKICGSDAAWIDLKTWKDRLLEEAINPGDRICLGFDGSLREDSTALVACRLVDGHTSVLGSWEKPLGPQGNGWQVPRLEVDGLVDKAFAEYDVVRMYCDPPHWQDYVDRWAATYGDKVVLEFWTNSGIRMAKALERLHTAVMAGEITHDGDPVLAKHVGNAVGVLRAGGIQVNKRKKSDKIDALIAATLAYEARNDAIADGALVNPLAAYIRWDDL